MSESFTPYETIQPILDVEIEYPRHTTRSIEELAVYSDTEATLAINDQQRLGQAVLAGEQFWLGADNAQPALY